MELNNLTSKSTPDCSHTEESYLRTEPSRSTLGTISDNDNSIRTRLAKEDDGSSGHEQMASSVSSASTSLSTKTNTDLDIIDLDENNDPEHPYNWSSRQIMFNCVVTCICAFLAPLGATIFAPAAPQAVSEFDVHSLQLATFVVSVDVLGFAFGPLLLAPLSEVYGRVKLYSACNIAFLISTVLCGSAPNMNFLIVFRFLSGTFGAGAGTVGAGAIADMVRPEKRAGVMALCGIGSLLGPILGPIFGGFINASWGWRWTQWTVAIAAAVPAISIFFTFKECYHPVLLERKVAKLRNETGKLSLKSKYDQGLSPANYLKRSIVRPLKLLFRSPIVAMSALFIGMSYAILFVMFTSLSTVFHDTYHFSESGIGLSFVGLGVGSAIGVVVYSVASNRYMTKKKAANSESVVATNENDTVANQDAPGANADGSPPESLEQAAEGLQPEDRLFLLPIGSLMTPIGLLIFGWTVQYRVHWIVPIMSTSLISGGNFIIYMSLQMFLMDSFPTYSASALAAMMVVRSLLAAFLPLSGLELYDKLGFGWGNTLLAFLLVLFIPVAFLGKRFGGVLRKRYKINNL